jgi:hypothetical protein
MAVTIVEEHVAERAHYIRLRFSAQGDEHLVKFMAPKQKIGAQANILTGGDLTAFTVSVFQSMNPTVTPIEPGVVLTNADAHAVAAVAAPFLSLLVTTTLWTGASTLEVVLLGLS